jgi:hypothetical protein
MSLCELYLLHNICDFQLIEVIISICFHRLLRLLISILILGSTAHASTYACLLQQPIQNMFCFMENIAMNKSYNYLSTPHRRRVMGKMLHENHYNMAAFIIRKSLIWNNAIALFCYYAVLFY